MRAGSWRSRRTRRPSAGSRRRRLNDLDNVSVLQLAAADRPGELRLSSEGHHESHALTDGDDGVAVRATTISLLVAELGLPRIDFLKMNIEGAERLALPGMEEVAPRVANLAIGCQDFLADRGGDASLRTETVVRAWMADHGYTVVGRRPDDLDPASRCWVYGTR